MTTYSEGSSTRTLQYIDTVYRFWRVCTYATLNMNVETINQGGSESSSSNIDANFTIACLCCRETENPQGPGRWIYNMCIQIVCITMIMRWGGTWVWTNIYTRHKSAAPMMRNFVSLEYILQNIHLAEVMLLQYNERLNREIIHAQRTIAPYRLGRYICVVTSWILKRFHVVCRHNLKYSRFKNWSTSFTVNNRLKQTLI